MAIIILVSEELTKIPGVSVLTPSFYGGTDSFTSIRQLEDLVWEWTTHLFTMSWPGTSKAGCHTIRGLNSPRQKGRDLLIFFTSL